MTIRVCSQSGCQIHTTGKCLEGFDPVEECPYVSSAAVPDNVSEPEPSISKFVDLPSGDALSSEQANQIARSGPTRLVVVAGPYGSGKTTIITSLYESFQEAPVSGYLFGGSRTLVGFEKRCHDGRAHSGRLTPETPHTSMRNGERYLHLRLATLERASLRDIHLLLADISGEQFAKIRDSSAAAQDLQALKRADQLCLVVDGEKVVDPKLRHGARNDTRSILRSILEANVLSPSCRIDAVFTKWDIIVNAMRGPQKESLGKYLEQTRLALSSVRPSLNLQFHEVAARPRSSAVPFAHGVPTLLRSWLANPADKRLPAVYFADPHGTGREMSRLTASVIAGRGLEEAYDVHWQ